MAKRKIWSYICHVNVSADHYIIKTNSIFLRIDSNLYIFLSSGFPLIKTVFGQTKLLLYASNADFERSGIDRTLR